MTVRISVQAAELAAASAWAERFTPRRIGAAALGGVLLDAREDTLSLSGYDLATAGTARIQATVSAPGAALLSARLLAAVAKTMKTAGTASIDTTGGVGIVTSGSSTWELPTLDEREFPALPVLGEARGTVDGAALADALARVLPAASVADDPTFHGAVAVSGDTETLTLASTDRFRLAVAELDWQAPDELAEVMVPAALLRDALSAVRDAGPVTVHADPHGVGLAGRSLTVVGRRVAADMPWRRIDPNPEVTTALVVLVETAELRAALDRATAVLDKEESLTVTFEHTEITVEPTAGTRGRARHAIEALGVTGEAPRALGVNPTYLRAALDALGSYAARICFAPARWAPVLIQPADEQGDPQPGYRHVVAQQRMPKAATA